MEWEKTKEKLSISYKFQDFAEAFAFMIEVAMHAEKQNHHPKWCNTWNQVDIELTTHDEGNIVTDKDYALAAQISKIYQKFHQEKM